MRRFSGRSFALRARGDLLRTTDSSHATATLRRGVWFSWQFHFAQRHCPSRIGAKISRLLDSTRRIFKILLLILFSAVLVAKRIHQRRPTFARNDPAAPANLAPLAAWVISVGVMVFERPRRFACCCTHRFWWWFTAITWTGWVVIGLALFAAGTLVAYLHFEHAGSAYGPGWIRSRSDGTGYQNRAVAFQLRATGGIFGTRLGGPTPRHPPISSSPRSAKSTGWWA